MKIIDEKGRLFGKINIIDFFVIVFLLCLMPMFYFGYRILAKKPPIEMPEEKEFVELEIDCRFIKLEPEILKFISVGDKELDENGETIGEIIGLGEVKPYTYEFIIGEEKEIIKKASDLKQLPARLKLRVVVKENRIYYKGREIKIGSPLEFKTEKYTLTIILPKVEVAEKEEVAKEKMIDLFIVLKDLNEDTLKLISVGDKEVDKDNKIIAEILSLGKIENNSLEFDLGKGNFVIGEDSSKKQISTKMRLNCQIKKENQLYFKGKRIERNSLIEFKTDKYKVIGMVAKSFEITPSIEERWILLEVKFSGIVPEIADIIQKGAIERDTFGKIVARIVSVISNKPSQVLTLKDNEFVILNHPFNRDILISLKVLCIEKDGVYYFKNYPVKMGNNIAFSTDLYSITGLIIGMEIQ